MKKKLLFLIFSFYTVLIAAQEKEQFLNTIVNFVIRKQLYRSQQYVDSITKTIAANPKKGVWTLPNGMPAVNAKISLPKPPPLKAYNFKANTYFIVAPTSYITYTTKDDFGEKIVSHDGVGTYITKIDRPEMTKTKFVVSAFNLLEKEKPSAPKELPAYLEIYKINKENKKIIAGYNCYQILLRHIKTKRITELYVTEEIGLNYNPIFNYEKELKKYYPLSMKIYYDNNNLNDHYDEYTFHKWEYPDDY